MDVCARDPSQLPAKQSGDRKVVGIRVTRGVMPACTPDSENIRRMLDE